MIHDYTHCLNQDKDCPKECFRRQLNEDLKKKPQTVMRFVSWANLKGTEECKKGENTYIRP